MLGFIYAFRSFKICIDSIWYLLHWKNKVMPCIEWLGVPVSSVQSLSHVYLFATPWNSNSWSLLKFMSIESVMPSNHLIFCCPLLFPSSIFPSIRVFSNESILCIMWPEYWSFSFSISPSNEYSALISFRLTGLISWQSKGLSRAFSNTTVQKHQVP